MLLSRLAVVLSLVALVGTCSAVPAVEPDQALLILNSDGYAATEATIASLEALGARAQHVLSPSGVIASVPVEAEAAVMALPGVAVLYRGVAPVTSGAGPTVSADIGAWNNLVSPRTASTQPPGSPLAGDALRPPEPPKTLGVTTAAAPGTYQTSEYMIGKVAVGVILPESNGSGENWTVDRRNTVFDEIVAALNWWVTRGGTAAHLTFYYDKRFSVPTQYEPITMNGWSDESTWVSDIFQNMGYTNGSSFDRAYAYINNLRNTMKTDWCYTFIVVDSLNDPDGKFTSGERNGENFRKFRTNSFMRARWPPWENWPQEWPMRSTTR